MVKRANISPADVERQREIAEEICSLHQNRHKQPLALVDTYGCQQNEADSEIIRGYLVEMGYALTDSEHEADVILINTCAVREHAENRVWGNVGALVHTKREKPDQIIAVCGCMAGQEHVVEKLRKSFPHVDLVFDPHALWRLPEMIKQLLSERGRMFMQSEGEGAIAENLPQVRIEGPSAWLSVMYGCNNFCTYCIVPHVRGRERSRTPEHILNDVYRLLADGVKDITLLGQNVNSYGKDLDETIDFADLLEQINAVPGEFLIRFATSHPKDADERLFAAMAKAEKVAKHIHLPFQAGNSRVLQSMNRGYTKEEYIERIAMARHYMPDLVVTGDVIVGFPGETEKEFQDTLDLMRRVEFDALYTFIYSPRKGTPAADMEDIIPRSEKQVWFDSLCALQNEISTKKHKEYVGTVQYALIDKAEEAPNTLVARTNGGRLIRLSGDASLIGQFKQIEITDASTWSLIGQLVK